MMAPHEVLGLPKDANEDEILTVRRVLVRKVQPDVLDAEDASDRLQAINSACDAMLAALAESGRSRPATEYTTRTKADASFYAPHRMVPSQDVRRKMEAALIGYVRQRSTAGTVAHAIVDRVDYVDNLVRFRLDRTPLAGRVLVAVPRLMQDGPSALRQDSATALIELDISDQSEACIRLSQADARRCVANARGLAVEIQLPSNA